MPAKKTATKRPAKGAKRATRAGKPDGWTAKMRAAGAENCSVCGRLMVDMKSHQEDHKSGKIGKDGKRTKRPAKEAAAWRNRYNGSDATKRFEDMPAEKRAIAKPLVKA